ncbi:TerB N-terminal domain-containing protein, partial [Vibrio parahaemolyticus]
GLEVSENKTRLKFDYRPASRLMQNVNINVGDLPDPSRLTTPIKRLAEIADDCTELLNPLSRYLAKEGSQRTDLSALLLMPEELIEA